MESCCQNDCFRGGTQPEVRFSGELLFRSYQDRGFFSALHKEAHSPVNPGRHLKNQRASAWSQSWFGVMQSWESSVLPDLECIPTGMHHNFVLHMCQCLSVWGRPVVWGLTKFSIAVQSIQASRTCVGWDGISLTGTCLSLLFLLSSQPVGGGTYTLYIFVRGRLYNRESCEWMFICVEHGYMSVELFPKMNDSIGSYHQALIFPTAS